ncbi:MAG: sporulation peptidase YabG [Bacillota bacterium]
MNRIKPGSVVTRKSYGGDILFKVQQVIHAGRGRKVALLKGLDIRLVADAPLEDLELKDSHQVHVFNLDVSAKKKESIQQIYDRRALKRGQQPTGNEGMRGKETESYFEVPGKVLHLDGDPEYLQKCLNAYLELKIVAIGIAVSEQDQPKMVSRYLNEHMPDILVLTGHDAFIKGKKDFRDVNNYRNSKYFIEAVRVARRLEPGRDGLVIFAGACQSYFEAILDAGANFASSPQRVFIHAYDPVYIAEKLAYSPVNEILSLQDVIAHTITGADGVGGIETRGRFRMGFPKSPY